MSSAEPRNGGGFEKEKRRNGEEDIVKTLER
jgi:hypothetical protein